MNPAASSMWSEAALIQVLMQLHQGISLERCHVTVTEEEAQKAVDALQGEGGEVLSSLRVGDRVALRNTSAQIFTIEEIFWGGVVADGRTILWREIGPPL